MVKTKISKATERPLIGKNRRSNPIKKKRSSSTSKSSFRIKIRKPKTGTLYTCDGTAITVEHKYVFCLPFNKHLIKNKETESYLRAVIQYLVESSFMKEKKPMTEFDLMAFQNLTADTLNLLNFMIRRKKADTYSKKILHERMLNVLERLTVSLCFYPREEHLQLVNIMQYLNPT
jgi:hypothetical protein